MIHTGYGTPASLPKPMPSTKPEVMYVVSVSDQMFTMPRYSESVPSVTTKKDRPTLPISTPLTPRR